jgi:prolyl-tRNA editing enzyme YbaK/EbsC (Cys-tRNA(Pro) deacylase)
MWFLLCNNVQVTVEMVLKTLKLNGANATKLILAVVPEIAKQDWTKTRQELKVMK